MRRCFYVVLAGVLMILGSCLSFSPSSPPPPKDLADQYTISFSDSSSCIVVEGITFYGQGIGLNIANDSSQPIELVFRESFILHKYSDGPYIEDPVYIYNDRDSFFGWSLLNKEIYPHRRYADVFYPRSLGASEGYRNGAPYISKLDIQGSFSLTVFYMLNGEKQSFTLNFEKLPAQP
jgi:hypothetical protein